MSDTTNCTGDGSNGRICDGCEDAAGCDHDGAAKGGQPIAVALSPPERIDDKVQQAAILIREYCKSKKTCDECPVRMRERGCFAYDGMPSEWKLKGVDE